MVPYFKCNLMSTRYICEIFVQAWIILVINLLNVLRDTLLLGGPHVDFTAALCLICSRMMEKYNACSLVVFFLT